MYSMLHSCIFLSQSLHRLHSKTCYLILFFFISGQKAQTAVKAQLQQLAVNTGLHTIKRAKMETLCARGAILLNSFARANDKWLTTATACQRVSKTKSLVCMEGQSASEPEVLSQS